MACVKSYPPESKKELRQILKAVDNINPIVAGMLEVSTLTGLRYSDASQLTVNDMFINGQVRDNTTVIQQKPYNKRLSSGMTEARARELSKVEVFINPQCAEVLADVVHINHIDLKKGKTLLFHSSVNKDKPFTAQYVNKILKSVAFDLQLKYPLSTHSFRKMFAMLIVKNNASVHQVRDALGQSTLAATDHYLRTFMSETKGFTEKIKF